MAVDNCTVSTFDLVANVGDTVPAGVVTLVITHNLNAILDASEFSIGLASNPIPNEYVGGNVSSQVNKVVFSNNNNGTVNASIHHSSFIVQSTNDILIDIDRRPEIVEGDGGVIIKGCTDPTALNYNPAATVDDGSCQFPNDPVGTGTDVIGTGVVDLLSDVTVHNADIKVPDTKDPAIVDVVINHGPSAKFDVVLVNKGTGIKYDFIGGSFNSKSFLENEGHRRDFRKDARVYENLPKQCLYVNFPGISADTQYQFYIVPMSSDTILAEGVPTELNPLELVQKNDVTITLALASTSNSAYWTVASSDVSFSDRPGKRPVAYTQYVWPRDVETQPLLTAEIMDGQPGYKYFTLTAAFTASPGGGAATKSAGMRSAGALETDLSVPATLSGKDANDQFVIIPYAKIRGLESTFEANTLTVTGLFKVYQFGSYDQAYTIEIDNIVTLS